MNVLQQRAITAFDKAQKQALERHHVNRLGINHPTQINTTHYINLSSNDYLGLSQEPELIAAFQSASNTYGIGSGASHLITGHCNIHTELEQALATWLGREDAVLFSTGYMANLAALSSLLTRHDICLQDKLNHASLIDAGILSRANIKRYKHNDTDNISNLLSQYHDTPKLLATDGVFSMEGDIACLDAISSLCEKHQTLLMVDDAHGVGVLGEQGKGSCEYFELGSKEVPILMGTLGKAFGSFGAFIAGDRWLTQHLRQFARPYIYTTAIPPSIAAATLKSLELIQSQTWRREKLRHHITTLKTHLAPICQEFGLTLLPSETAIQSIIIGNVNRALAMSNELKTKGFWVSAIRPPTVPLNTSRLRITLTSLIDEADLTRFIDSLTNILRSQDL